MLKPFGKIENTQIPRVSFQKQSIFPLEKGRIIHLQFSIPFGKQGTPLWFDNLTQDEIILNSKKVTSPAMM